MINAEEAYKIAKEVANKEDCYIHSETLINDVYWFAIVPNSLSKTNKVYDINGAYSVNGNTRKIQKCSSSELISACMNGEEKEIDISNF